MKTDFTHDYRKEIEKYAAIDGNGWLAEAFSRTTVLAYGFSRICGVYLPFLRLALIKPDECEAVEFGTIVHELRHAWQCRTWGITKYLFKKAFQRRKIEADAEAEELKAVEWYAAPLAVYTAV
jgi:hypothetical protein